jgi:uncharacterized BrkB/YihY/UPF0761 family membrane protein
VVGTVAFQLSFQALPLYLGFSESQPALKAFNGLVVLLVWLFLMSNVLLLGAQVNHWYGRGRPQVRAADRTDVPAPAGARAQRAGIASAKRALRQRTDPSRRP